MFMLERELYASMTRYRYYVLYALRYASALRIDPRRRCHCYAMLPSADNVVTTPPLPDAAITTFCLPRYVDAAGYTGATMLRD